MSTCFRGSVHCIFSSVLGISRKGGKPVLKIAEGVRSTHDRDGAVILDIHHGQMFTLNLVGSKILEMLERGCPETQIVQEITRKFRIRPDIVERDVREFLECLEKHRLLESRAPK